MLKMESLSCSKNRRKDPSKPRVIRDQTGHRKISELW